MLKTSVTNCPGSGANFALSLSVVPIAARSESEEARLSSACSCDDTPDIANSISLEKGWKLVRVGTRVRNPMLGLPDTWEQRVLQDFKRRAAQGEKFDAMNHFEVVEEPAGKSLRFMKAIGTAPQCIVGHGSVEQIAEPVRAQLLEVCDEKVDCNDFYFGGYAYTCWPGNGQ